MNETLILVSLFVCCFNDLPWQNKKCRFSVHMSRSAKTFSSFVFFIVSVSVLCFNMRDSPTIEMLVYIQVIFFFLILKKIKEKTYENRSKYFLYTNYLSNRIESEVGMRPVVVMWRPSFKLYTIVVKTSILKIWNHVIKVRKQNFIFILVPWHQFWYNVTWLRLFQSPLIISREISNNLDKYPLLSWRLRYKHFHSFETVSLKPLKMAPSRLWSHYNLIGTKMHHPYCQKHFQYLKEALILL